MRRRASLAPFLAAALCACPTPSDSSGATNASGTSSSTSSGGAASSAAASSAASGSLTSSLTSSSTTSSASSSASSSTSGGTDGGSTQPSCLVEDVTRGVLQPIPGELFYVQLGLGGISLGESAIIVGPDGTVVLVDVGNNAHDDDVRAQLDALTTAMQQAGFTDVNARTVDHVLLTHHHADHVDGLGDLLVDVQVSGRIIHRGLVDITDAANSATVESLCTVLAAHAAQDFPLCAGPATAPCNASTWTGTYPSDGCPGLQRGDVGSTGQSTATHVPLGGTSRITLLAADATVGTARYESIMGPLLDSDVNGENARSVVGMIQHGLFRMVVAGDLTGGGSDTDPVEAFVASRLGSGVERGVDIMHASHHGRDTSSSAAWLDVILPRDARPRQVVMGISTAHVGSPHAPVIDALLDGRLSGGQVFTTRVAAGGTSRTGVVDAAGGTVRIRTEDGGARYLLQAVTASGSVVRTVRTTSALGCE